MLSFEKLYSMGHEEVVFFSDTSCGLKAIVAIHSTVLGPALGGTRIWQYSSEADAVEDALRLSRGMTYKAAISGLNLGGGKGVIIADPNNKSEALFRSYGRFLESLNGRYITAEDVNTNVEDIEQIYTETSNVVGVATVHGGSGNPSPYTALGVFRGIEASALKQFGTRDLKGKVIAVQGVGAVGRELIKLLHSSGARLLINDIKDENIKQTLDIAPDAEVIKGDDIYTVNCDIYSPCALGAIINDNTIDNLKCKVVAGAANNQLAEDKHGEILKKKGILYAPDYLINAGGLMNVSIEFEGWSDDKSRRMIDTIYDTTLNIFNLSDKENMSVNKATDLLAEKRIESIRKIQGTYLGNLSHRFPGRKSRR